MDIVRKKATTGVSKKPLLIGLAALLVITALWFFWPQASGVQVLKDTISTAEVKRGDMIVTVRGIGVLTPKDVRWVAAQVPGRVEQLLIKAGAVVNTGDLLMELSNPQLQQQLDETRWELDEMRAQTHAQVVSLESDLLDQQAAVINAKLNYERAMLTLQAQQTLLDKGVAAVSQIDHGEIKIEVAQLQQRWQLQQQRLAKRQQNLEAQRQAFEARLNRMQKIVQRAEQQVANLQIRATMPSIVQVMPMELGQQVRLGDNLARLARQGDFIAELRVPEQQIHGVAIGHPVEVDIRAQRINGTVIRIDPGVVNNNVQVDVALNETMPPQARPDLTVEGVIRTAELTDTLFVKRPMFAKANQQGLIYVLDEDGTLAERQPVQFGLSSSQFIQIKQGLNAGQRIIVSDASAWDGQTRISIH